MNVWKNLKPLALEGWFLSLSPAKEKYPPCILRLQDYTGRTSVLTHDAGLQEESYIHFLGFFKQSTLAFVGLEFVPPTVYLRSQGELGSRVFHSEVFEIKDSDQPPSHLDLTECLSESQPCVGEVPGRPSCIIFPRHIYVLLFPQLLGQLYEKIGRLLLAFVYRGEGRHWKV